MKEWEQKTRSFLFNGKFFGGVFLAEKKKNTAQTCTELALPVAEKLGVELWDVRFEKEGTEWYLRFFIDKEGLTIEDCENFSRAMDPILDEADPIEVSYQLEVSSPGIERDIRTEAHIAACMGEEIEARLYAPHEGKRVFVGILAAYEDGKVTLDTAEGELTLPRAAIAHMNTTYHE